MEPKFRAPRMSICLLTFFAVLVAAAHASTISLDRSTHKTCVQRCAKDNSLFSPSGQEIGPVHFELGKTYSYRVNSWSEARANYAHSPQHNTRDRLISVQAAALLTPVSRCELSLQLQNITLNPKNGMPLAGQPDAGQFIRQLEVPILFGYQNGVVSEVCPDSSENSLALYLKKSIISTFQTTPNLSVTEQVKVIESDMYGECETEYSVERQSWDKLLVTKRKDLNKCVNPAEQMDSNRNWKNIMHSTNLVAHCNQTIQGQQQLLSAQCQSVRTINTVIPSQYTVQLVSSVEIEINEVLSAEQYSAQMPNQWTRHAHRLMMAQPPSDGVTFNVTDKDDDNTVNDRDGRLHLTELLREICNDIDTNGQRVSLNTVQLVKTLADTLKQTSQANVLSVPDIVDRLNCYQVNKKKMMDIVVDTAASIMNLNTALIVRDELVKYINDAAEEQQEQDQFSLKRARYLATLVAFSVEPTAEAVRQIVPELLEKINDAQIVLSLSSLVKKTRQELNDAQLLESLYQTVLQKVLARFSPGENKRRYQFDENGIIRDSPRITSTSQVEDHQEVEIVRLLNALENIEPRTAVSGQEELVNLISNKRLFESIRVAAIKSVQHIKMQTQLRRTLFNIFTDRSEPNEMRIAAYRTLVHSQATVPELRQILTVTQMEQNVDVRNYVCSHQKTLRTTVDPKKRALLPLDAPLFPEPQSIANFLVSRNFEYSFVNPKDRTGVIVEADLIMESDSRVPRAVIFNLTVPFAEQQIPIVELTIRQQGLERSLMERIEKFKQLKSPAVMLQEVRRIMQSQHNGKLQVLINVDGKNIYVWDSSEYQKDPQKNQFDTILAKLYKQLPIQIDETMVIMPLKHRVRLPTSNGIPINFELNATLIASLETTIKGHQDVENLLEMHIKPTLVAELGVGLEVDLPFEGKKAERVQFLNRFITAPTLNVHFQNEPHARQLRVKILMPENEQTIVRFETLYSNEQDDGMVLFGLAESSLQNDTRKAILQEQQQRQWLNGTNRVQEKKCLPILDQALGFTYCVKTFSVDDLKAPLVTNRSSRTIFLAEIQLVKTDLQMEGIELGMELPKLFTPKSVLNELKFVFHFDTPNSKVNRRINTELVFRIPSQQTTTDKYLVQVAIDSPVKQISGQVAVLNQENHKGIVIELTTDRQRQFLLEADALFAVQDPTNTQVKIQLRVQPTAQSNVTKLEGEFVMNAQSEDKKKVQLRLQANEQQVLDLLLIQTGSLLQPVDLKLSAFFMVNLLGAEIESNALLNKNQQTGTIMSTGNLKYKVMFQFTPYGEFIREDGNKFESIDYQFQYTGFTQPITDPRWPTELREVKKSLYWTLQSSQFPQINQELTYNIKGRVPDEFEFNLKWSTEKEDNLVQLEIETKHLHSVTGNVKRLFQLAAVVTPLNLNHNVKIIFYKPDQSPKTKASDSYVVELKTADIKTAKVVLEAIFTSVSNSSDPLEKETKGEIKIFDGQQIFLFRDNVKEVSKHFFQGKTLIEVAESSNITRSMPKKIQLEYTFKRLDKAVPRLPFIGQLALNRFAQFVNSLEHFKHELIAETEAYGQIQHTGLIAIDAKNEWQLKSRLQLEQPKFTLEAELMSNSSEFKVEDQRMKHQIRFDRNGAFGTVQQWSIIAESQDKINGQKWLIQSEHQCHQFTTLQLDTPLVRGNIEVRLDSNRIHIDLTGDQQWQGLDHKTDAQLDVAADKLMIKSVTLRQGKPFVFVDAELYSTLKRNFTLKLEIEPLDFKSYIQANLKHGGELQITAQKWKQQAQLKKQFLGLSLQSETRKDDKIVLLFDTKLSPKKVQLMAELELKRFSPISVKGMFDLEHREMQLQIHNKRSDRLVKMEAKIKDFKNVHLEVKWDAARDQSKHLLFQTRVQNKETDPERFIATILIDIVDQPFEVKIDVPRTLNQLIKEIQMDAELQTNLLNQTGRQFDLKVDLARPLQKKFQVVSFTESIPTEGIESPRGENSRLAIQVSFQQEKKMELSLNWFGQWLRDFKLEALLKCFSKPPIELLNTSPHPAGADQIDDTLVASKEYVAKWVHKFDDSNKNWNTQTMLKVNGVNKFDLHVECVTKQIDEDRTLMVLKANLTGVKRATSLLNLTIRRKASNPLGIIEVVQWEVGNQQHERVVSFDLFMGVRDVHQSGNRTGVKLAAHDKTIFSLTHITNDRVDGQNNQTSMVRLELPDQIEYVLRNEIEFRENQPDQIKSIQSELIRKQYFVEPIYHTRIIFGKDEKRDLKVIRVEIQSNRFTRNAFSGGQHTLKIVEIRYNFSPESYQCYNIPLTEFYNFSPYGAPGDKACWRFEMLIGEAQNKQQHRPQQGQFELQSKQQFDIKIGADYFKYPVDSRHTNRTIRFNIASYQKQNELGQSDLALPINFTLFGHASVHAIGLAWKINNDEEIGTTIDLQEDKFSDVVNRLAASKGKYFCGPLLPALLDLQCPGKGEGNTDLGNFAEEYLGNFAKLLMNAVKSQKKIKRPGVRTRRDNGFVDQLIMECCKNECHFNRLQHYCQLSSHDH